MKKGWQIALRGVLLKAFVCHSHGPYVKQRANRLKERKIVKDGKIQKEIKEVRANLQARRGVQVM